MPGTGEPIDPPTLVAGDWIATTVEGLRLREEPSTGSTLIRLLPIGYAGTVVEGPLEVDGYEWVHVATPGLPANTGCLSEQDCPRDGWVATADLLGNPWVEVAKPECTPSPITVRAMGAHAPGLRLACFGGVQLSLVGYVASESEGRGCKPNYGVDPEWFHPCAQFFVDGDEVPYEGTTGWITARIHPSLGEPCGLTWRSSTACPLLPYAGSWVRVSGQYDHPDAATCVGVPVPDMGQPPSDGRIVYDCRLSFVVTAIEPASAP